MSTLNVVEKVLRERAIPMVVREIVEAAGAELPTRSRTPDTVVARDLAMEIKRNGEASKFVRTSPGKYTLRELAAASYLAAGSTDIVPTTDSVPVPVAVAAPADPVSVPVPVALSVPSDSISHQ